MRILSLALALLAAALTSPVGAREPSLRPGEVLVTRADIDLNSDRRLDIAYVTAAVDGRSLVIAITNGPSETLELDSTPFGGGTLSLRRGVLSFEDLTGGTTAIASTRRYRFDAKADRMRLIGLEATRYSRTNAHDGFELSWNLLDGSLITRELHLNRSGGDAAYDPIVERRAKRRSAPIWLSQTPDPDALLDELARAEPRHGT